MPLISLATLEASSARTMFTIVEGKASTLLEAARRMSTPTEFEALAPELRQLDEMLDHGIGRLSRVVVGSDAGVGTLAYRLNGVQGALRRDIADSGRASTRLVGDLQEIVRSSANARKEAHTAIRNDSTIGHQQLLAFDGLHFPSDIEAGAQIGRKAGDRQIRLIGGTATAGHESRKSLAEAVEGAGYVTLGDVPSIAVNYGDSVSVGAWVSRHGLNLDGVELGKKRFWVGVPGDRPMLPAMEPVGRFHPKILWERPHWLSSEATKEHLFTPSTTEEFMASGDIASIPIRYSRLKFS